MFLCGVRASIIGRAEWSACKLDATTNFTLYNRRINTFGSPSVSPVLLRRSHVRVSHKIHHPLHIPGICFYIANENAFDIYLRARVPSRTPAWVTRRERQNTIPV